MKFVKRETKVDFIKASGRLKPHGSSFNYTPALPIFCDEQLTKYTQNLVVAAKKLRAEGLVKFVWVTDGVVRVKQNDSSPTIRIDHISQLEPAAEGLSPDKTLDEEPSKINQNSQYQKQVNLHTPELHSGSMGAVKRTAQDRSLDETATSSATSKLKLFPATASFLPTSTN